MRFNYPLLLVLLLSFSIFGFAASELENLARVAVDGEKTESDAAIKALRLKKQAGLDAVFEVFGDQISDYSKSSVTTSDWYRISNVLDSIAMQKDAYSSRLFWHTDLDSATKEATKSQKPILSLRLLGGLNEEYSCANSRFFRSILYSDPAIAKNLRENYVLHWKSVRPAPKITIDFGDGRTLVRTITGNSIHYVLHSSGHIIDALPGLYSPQVFNKYLTELKKVTTAKQFDLRTVEDYRLKTAQSLVTEWDKRISFLGDKRPDTGPETLPAADTKLATPFAIDAAPRAVTKMAVEISAVQALLPQIERLRVQTGVDDWKPLASISGTVSFSKESLRLIRSKSGDISNVEFSRLVKNLEEYVAIDTVQNEYRFHTQILSWLNPRSSSNLDEFNRIVYSRLFLTPDSDKWLGLYAPDIYSAIENNGIIK